MPLEFFTRKRVSRRICEVGSPLVNSMLKCLIQIVPAGNDQLPLGLKPIVELVLGTENQRDLMALSDQNGTLIVYGRIPGAGCRVSCALCNVNRLVDAPASYRVGGSGVPLVEEL